MNLEGGEGSFIGLSQDDAIFHFFLTNENEAARDMHTIFSFRCNIFNFAVYCSADATMNNILSSNNFGLYQPFSMRSSMLSYRH